MKKYSYCKFIYTFLFFSSICISTSDLYCMLNANENEKNYKKLFDNINKCPSLKEKIKNIFLFGNKKKHANDLEEIKQDFFLNMEPSKKTHLFKSQNNDDFKIQIMDLNKKSVVKNDLESKIDQFSAQVEIAMKGYTDLSTKLQQAVLLITGEQNDGNNQNDAKDKQNKMLSLIKVGILGYLFYCQLSGKK